MCQSRALLFYVLSFLSVKEYKSSIIDLLDWNTSCRVKLKTTLEQPITFSLFQASNYYLLQQAAILCDARTV